MSGFYDRSELERVAINLFHGWGYNFYRDENQLRADDLLVRSKAGAILGECRAIVEAAETTYRRAHIAAPTRAKPFPDPEVVRDAQALERLSAAIGVLEGQVRAQPVPGNDRMTQLFRDERDTLIRLGTADRLLVGQAELLRSALGDTEGAEGLLRTIVAIQAMLHDMDEMLSERRAVLQG